VRTRASRPIEFVCPGLCGRKTSHVPFLPKVPIVVDGLERRIRADVLDPVPKFAINVTAVVSVRHADAAVVRGHCLAVGLVPILAPMAERMLVARGDSRLDAVKKGFR